MDLKEKAGNVFEREALRRELQAMLSDYLEDREVRSLSWNELLYIFLTSAVFGSLVESLWCRVLNGFWERRTSVLFGDLSFAEAIGGTFLTVVLRKDLDAKPGDIFVKSLFWGTVLEYIRVLGRPRGRLGETDLSRSPGGLRQVPGARAYADRQNGDPAAGC